MTTQRRAGPGDTWRRTPRVLIIDDDAGYRAQLADMFVNWQWDVFEASSGREALDTLERHAINLVLLDAASQGMGCPDVLAAIQVRPHDLRIIVMDRDDGEVAHRLAKPGRDGLSREADRAPNAIGSARGVHAPVRVCG